MRGRSKILELAISIGVLAGANCSQQPTAAGGSGTDAPNSITLVAQGGTLSGHGGFAGILEIYDTGYEPVKDQGFHLDVPLSPGRDFSSPALPPGIYNLIARSEDGTQAVFFPAVSVIASDDTLRDTLKKTVCVEGGIFDSQGVRIRDATVYLQGTDLVDTTDSLGSFAIAGVPIGLHRLKSSPIFPIQGSSMYQQADTTFKADDDMDIGNLQLITHY